MKHRICWIVVIFCLALFESTLTSSAMDQEKTDGNKIRVACVGNSVTRGYGLTSPETESYPAQLQKILGNHYEVANFGHSGATLLSKGHRPYIQTQEYPAAKAYEADFIIIHLGLNDTDPRNWPNYRDEFIPDYMQLINSFREGQDKKPQIYICRMSPIFNQHPRFKSGTRDWFWQIQEAIEKVAANCETELIDLHTPLYNRPDLFADALHPDAEGASIIAQTVYEAITGDFGGLNLAPIFADHMVLQQNKSIPVWGKANRNEKIVAQLNGQTQIGTADNSGNWKLTFDPLPAGGPYQLTITSDSDQTILIKDLLVGEVWICAGQSNMEFQLKEDAYFPGEITNLDHSKIRLFNEKGIVRPDNCSWDSLSLQRINKLDFFEGNWQQCNSTNAPVFSAIGYYFGKELNQALNVPVGLIQITVGGALIEAFIDRKTMEFEPNLVNVLYNWKQNDFIMDWCRERAARNSSLSKSKLQRHPYEPAYIFEAGVQQLAGLPVAGVIWYQGESNAHNPEHYRNAFPMLVQSWRTAFMNTEMPFYFAQLSSLNRPSWPHFRAMQAQFTDLIPNIGMVVTSDLGDSLNVHPVRKKEIGKRFAALALNGQYGSDIACNGPVPRTAIQKNSEIVIEFDHAEILKSSDDRLLREIEACSEDGIFFPVHAEIQKNTIRIKKINKNTEKVRYGWKPYSRGNLVNEIGLPASTFVIKVNQK